MTLDVYILQPPEQKHNRLPTANTKQVLFGSGLKRMWGLYYQQFLIYGTLTNNILAAFIWILIKSPQLLTDFKHNNLHDDVRFNKYRSSTPICKVTLMTLAKNSKLRTPYMRCS